MSAENGGRGVPPVPPEGHGPPEQVPQIPLICEVVRQSHGVEAQKTTDGMILSVIVLTGAGAEKLTFLVGELGRKAVLDALTGGIVVPE